MPDPRDAKIERLERENDRLRKDLHAAATKKIVTLCTPSLDTKIGA